jgi:hypothetical protein
MIRLRPPCRSVVTSPRCGASASSLSAWPASTSVLARAVPELLPPEVVVQVNALACELPLTLVVPLSRLSIEDVGREVRRADIAPFDRLVAQAITQPPSREARRVLWIMDNGSSHRGDASVRRLQTTFRTLVPVHGPIHASWLDQNEIHFSILQRITLTPHDFGSLADIEDWLMGFERYSESIAAPFDWRFTKHDLDVLVATLSTAADALRPAA